MSLKTIQRGIYVMIVEENMRMYTTDSWSRVITK